ncbi:MAG: prepilin-type N-terminal cleavage/methylation domain-containing protein [Bacteroidota bacterium]
MNIEPKKIKAFTLSEMIVVLLITTIVVGMAFAVLNLVQKQMDGISGTYDRGSELNRLRRSLWIDFNRFNSAVHDTRGGQIFFTNELETVTYRFQEVGIIKERDTFHLGPTTYTTYFENVPKSIGEIDALHLRTGKAYGEQQLFVYKNSPAWTYMNQ